MRPSRLLFLVLSLALIMVPIWGLWSWQQSQRAQRTTQELLDEIDISYRLKVGDAEIARRLQKRIATGASVTGRGKATLANRGTKVTPLHAAAGYGLPRTCRVLLEAGAEPDALDTQGNTPLLWCVQQPALGRGGKYVETAALLIESGADANRPREDGKSLVDEALARGDRKMAQLLKDAVGAKPTAGVERQ